MPAASTSMCSVQVLDFRSFGPLIPHGCLVCSSCSSGQRFASGFLQIPPHDGHPCLPLTVPPVGPVEDLQSSATAHLQVRAHAGRTKKKSRGIFSAGPNGLLLVTSYSLRRRIAIDIHSPPQSVFGLISAGYPDKVVAAPQTTIRFVEVRKVRILARHYIAVGCVEIECCITYDLNVEQIVGSYVRNHEPVLVVYA